MNYIKLLNTFWQIRRERTDFDPYVISLYVALVSVANDKATKQAWGSFSIYREDITQLAGLSPTSYYKARKILKDAGLIDYTEGANKLSKSIFTINPVYATNTLDGTLQEQLTVPMGNGEPATEKTLSDTILNKPINLETYKPLEPKGSDLTDREKSFLDFFNNSCGRRFTSLPEKAKKQLCNLHNKNYTGQDFSKAVLDGYQDSLKWPDPSKFTPEYLTRLDNFQKYLFADSLGKKQPAASSIVPKSVNESLSEQANNIYI